MSGSVPTRRSAGSEPRVPRYGPSVLTGPRRRRSPATGWASCLPPRPSSLWSSVRLVDVIGAVVMFAPRRTSLHHYTGGAFNGPAALTRPPSRWWSNFWVITRPMARLNCNDESRNHSRRRQELS